MFPHLLNLSSDCQTVPPVSGENSLKTQRQNQAFLLSASFYLSTEGVLVLSKGRTRYRDVTYQGRGEVKGLCVVEEGFSAVSYRRQIREKMEDELKKLAPGVSPVQPR